MRRLDPALQAHLNQQCTTVCQLVKILLADGRVFGLTSLDRNVEWQGVTYAADAGADASIIATDAELSVDNGEVKSLFTTETGLRYDEVVAGALENARWEMYLANYKDLSQTPLLLDVGDIGRVKVFKNLNYTAEMLSYVVRLRQTIGGVDSVRCRAEFGTAADSQTGCGVNANKLWVVGEVTGVSDEENDRVFADSGIPIKTEMDVARVQFLTGRNASSKLYQVEAYSLKSGTIALLEPTAFPIVAGDQFRIRPDCARIPEHCKQYNNFINYKGEPYIPVSGGAEALTPRAELAGGLLGGTIND